jgi:hypothetical protein
VLAFSEISPAELAAQANFCLPHLLTHLLSKSDDLHKFDACETTSLGQPRIVAQIGWLNAGLNSSLAQSGEGSKKETAG